MTLFLTASSFYSIFTQVPITLNSTVALQGGFLKRLGDTVLLDLFCLSLFCFFMSLQTDWWWSDQISVWSTGCSQTIISLDYYRLCSRLEMLGEERSSPSDSAAGTALYSGRTQNSSVFVQQSPKNKKYIYFFIFNEFLREYSVVYLISAISLLH